MKYKIQVTLNDIQKGKRDHRSCCPVAKAIRRQTTLKQFCVNDGYLSIFDDDAWEIEEIQFPKKVVDFVNKFDENGAKAVKPFDFVLNLKAA